MATYAYDIECFKNLFSATFVDINNENNVFAYCIGLGRDDRSALCEFLTKSITLVGYNNHSYDDPLLRYILLNNVPDLLSELYAFSSKLTDDNYRSDKTVLEYRYPKKTIFNWSTIDLMRILAFDKLGISLKQTAINLKWRKIQDIPINPETRLKEEDLKTILDYNLNDVLITKRLYEEIAPLRDLRDNLSSLYHVDLRSASDSRIANLILENIYQNELRMDIRSIRDMRTRRDKVLLGDCMAKFVDFQTPQLRELQNMLSSTMVYSYNNFRYSHKLYFANCTFVLGIGGLHSEDRPGVFVTDNEYIIQDMDVASYYPNLIINNNFYPAHLGENFIRVLNRITSERILAKKAGDKTKADGLKITINSIFGKLGSEHFWLLDPKQFLSTTVSGQMGLLMLIEDLYLNGIEIISCNTDGVVCKIKRNMLDSYYKVAKRWEEKTNLQLEYTLYKKYVRRDVNSYITEKEDGSTKEKGAFYKEVDLKKSYHMPIVPKALHAYFIHGTPVRKTLETADDIMDFCISQKSGNNFEIEFHTTSGIEKLQKTNRFFISKKGGSLIKRDKISGKGIGLYVGRLVRVLNDYDASVPFSEYNVDLSFYEKEAMKIIEEIEPKQMTFFTLDFNEKGEKIQNNQFLIPKGSIVNEKTMSINDINKLGKIQFIKKIESIVFNKERIEGINPRYVYVEEFSPSKMQAQIYVLSKGIRKTIDINKKTYREKGLERGTLLYCSKFGKLLSGEYSLVDYRITEKIEEQKEQLL